MRQFELIPDKVILSFDNGSTANATILYPNGNINHFQMPVKKCKNYQKTDKTVTRIDTEALEKEITSALGQIHEVGYILVLERPFVNPRAFKATLSAVRALEALLIVLEKLGLDNYIFVDSKEWQKETLPGIVGREELKKASLALGKKWFPLIKIKKDADSLLMAVWAANDLCHK